MTPQENSRQRKSLAPMTRPFIGVWDGFINPSVEKRKRRPNLIKRATCNKRRNNHFKSRCSQVEAKPAAQNFDSRTQVTGERPEVLPRRFADDSIILSPLFSKRDR